jgi:hypothetical protein
MTAAIILAFSVLALLSFSISQWRMIWLTTANQPISDSLRAATGLDADAIGPNELDKLLGLCDELSPLIKKRTPWLREVAFYHFALRQLQRTVRSIQPMLSKWAAGEMATCSRYVAVVLDQNLSVDLDRRATARAT